MTSLDLFLFAGKCTALVLGSSVAVAVGCSKKKEAKPTGRPPGVTPSMVSAPPPGPTPVLAAPSAPPPAEKRTEEVDKKKTDEVKVVKEEEKIKEKSKIVVEEKDGKSAGPSAPPAPADGPKEEEKKEVEKSKTKPPPEPKDDPKKEAPVENPPAEKKVEEQKPEADKKPEPEKKEEIKPKKVKLDAKAQRIHDGKEKRGKGDYPTMDDVLSDWDSKKDGPEDVAAAPKSKKKEVVKAGKGNTKEATNLDDPEAEGEEKKKD